MSETTTTITPVARMIADWVEGSPDDSRHKRRVRLLTYRRAGQNRYGLGMLLVRAASDLALQGQNPGPESTAWKKLILPGRPYWENRMYLAATVLQILDERHVDVSTYRVSLELAREEAAALLGEMAFATDDPEAKAVDWTSGMDEEHFFGAA
ncbi:hypothetical protein [Streptomyces sp. NPDC007088]|uniref:hypothetical protein n=1 Tax=Streptomyces sp. NPDC007088 TaxID=3364773 RepID=UPI00368DE592